MPASTPKKHDTAERGKGQHERALAHAGEAPDGGDVGQRERGRDHHRGEGRLREVREDRVEEQEHECDAGGADQPGELALRPGLLGDGGARAARRHGEALEQPGGEVRRADADHLLVRVDLFTASRREAGRRGDRVGQGDERDPDRGDEQRQDVVDVGPRELRLRQALRQGADRLHVEVEHGGHDRRPDDRDEHSGYLAHDTGEQEEHGQRGEADRDRRAVALVEAVDERAELVDEAVRVGREPAELGQLADDDREGEPVHVADLHLLREEVGDEAELGDAEADLDERDQEGHHAGQRDRPRRIVAGHDQRRDRGEDQRSERRVRPEHQDPARSHDRVPDEAGDRRVQPRDRGKPGQLCVGHALGHEDRREDDAGDEVEVEPASPVGARHAEPRHDAGGAARTAVLSRRAGDHRAVVGPDSAPPARAASDAAGAERRRSPLTTRSRRHSSSSLIVRARTVAA